jgi:hypothetical protein
MRLRTVLSLATLFFVCSTVSVWSLPLPPQSANATPDPAAVSQSVSGKIASVGDASFAVEVKKGNDLQTLQFQIDRDTKIQGKLEVGAQAMVEYRSDEGKNVALSVIVQQSAPQHLN